MRNEIVVVLGKKGTGKTTWTKNFLKDRNRFIIFDYNREYGNLGYVVSSSVKLIDVIKLNYDKNFRIVYQPDDTETLDQHVEHISSIAYATTNLTFVLEEADLVSDASTMPDGLAKLVNYGRHRAIDLVVLSRRAHRMPRDITANADIIITYVQREPRDIKYISDYMGSDVAAEVQKLQKTENFSEFIIWKDGEYTKGKTFLLTGKVEINKIEICNKTKTDK